MSIFYVSHWKSSYDFDNEMARNIARVKLTFLFNSENSVIHSYLYNKYRFSFSCLWVMIFLHLRDLNLSG